MIPGMNPRKMQQMMKQMGIQQTELEATEVIIKTSDKEYVFTSPQVSKVNMMGQLTYQIVGTPHERSRTNEIEISDEDIKTIVEQVGCSEEVAKKALKETGDLAEAILKINE